MLFSAPRGGLFIQGLKEGQNTPPCYNGGGPTGAVAIYVRVCVCVWWGCSFKQAFEWPNCIGIQQSESWLRSRRAAGGVSARTSTATLSKRAPAQSTQLMLSLSLTLSPLFVLSYFSPILLLLTPISSSLSLSSVVPPSLLTASVCRHSPTVLILPYSLSVSLVFDAHNNYSKDERRGSALVMQDLKRALARITDI